MIPEPQNSGRFGEIKKISFLRASDFLYDVIVPSKFAHKELRHSAKKLYIIWAINN
jgi:hypothetical protein